MHFAHLSRVDLNLLVALDVLLAERSVTQAAGRLGVTQPAMSRTLGRLRKTFGDPLLVRTGRELLLTERARQLQAPVKRVLGELEGVLLDRPTFEPSTARRTFTVATSDYGEAVLLPALMSRLDREAPGISVEIPGTAREGLVSLDRGEVDVVLGLQVPAAASVVWRKLFSDDFATLMRKGHPASKGRLTPERFATMRQLLVSPEGRPGSMLDDALAKLKLERRVSLTLRSFLAAPLVVAQSDLLVTTAARVAQRMAALLDLSLVSPPVALPRFTFCMAWHERSRHDPAHRWFRGLVETTAAALDGPGRPR